MELTPMTKQEVVERLFEAQYGHKAHEQYTRTRTLACRDQIVADAALDPDVKRGMTTLAVEKELPWDDFVRSVVTEADAVLKIMLEELSVNDLYAMLVFFESPAGRQFTQLRLRQIEALDPLVRRRLHEMNEMLFRRRAALLLEENGGG